MSVCCVFSSKHCNKVVITGAHAFLHIFVTFQFNTFFSVFFCWMLNKLTYFSIFYAKMCVKNFGFLNKQAKKTKKLLSLFGVDKTFVCCVYAVFFLFLYILILYLLFQSMFLQKKSNIILREKHQKPFAILPKYSLSLSL